MKTTLFLFLICTLSNMSIKAQQVPTPTPFPQSTPIPQVNPRTSKVQQITNAYFSDINDKPDPPPPEGMALTLVIVQEFAQPLYRKPTAEELNAIAPRPDVLAKFSDFLKRPKTGIFRMVVDAGCAGNSKVVVATDDCLKYKMPGAGSAFSFRTASYRITRLADLMLNGAGFSVPGEFMHGLLTNLGDVPIEGVDLRSPGMKFITEFQSVADFEKAHEIDEILIKGVTQNGYLYSRAARVSENSTYALRVIAYGGNVTRSVRGASYNELDFDKRKDMTIAFRTVDRGADGSFTIIWTELSRTDAPKLKRTVAKLVH